MDIIQCTECQAMCCGSEQMEAHLCRIHILDKEFYDFEKIPLQKKFEVLFKSIEKLESEVRELRYHD